MYRKKLDSRKAGATVRESEEDAAAGDPVVPVRGKSFSDPHTNGLSPHVTKERVDWVQREW